MATSLLTCILFYVGITGCFSLPSTYNGLIQGKIGDGWPMNALPNEFPWMALIFSPSRYPICGGSLISSSYILTAGHCLLGIPSKNDLLILLGVHNKSSLHEPHLVENIIEDIISHPDNENTIIFKRDFRLVKLAFPVTFNEAVRPICLPPPGLTFEGETAVAAGWGFFSNGGKNNDLLQKVELPIFNQHDCAELYKWINENVTDDMICAERIEKDNKCQDDSGGPLMWKDQKDNWHLIGIISWGEIWDTFIRFPGVYARVSYATDWIKSVVSDLKECE